MRDERERHLVVGAPHGTVDVLAHPGDLAAALTNLGLQLVAHVQDSGHRLL